MKILIISQYYPPEVGALATRMSNLAKHLKKKGHDITVICEIPNYPSGIVSSKYKYKFFVKEKYEGINVIRTFVCANSRKTNFQRMRFYLSFMFSSIISGMFLGDYDIILATSPPLFVGFSGYVLSRLTGGKFVLDIRDLWPESAVSLGELKPGPITNLAEKLEHFLYCKAHKISVAVPGFRNCLISKNVSDDKILDFPNGVDINCFYPREKTTELKKAFNIEQKFVVFFSGNHGLAQGLFTVLQAAEVLQSKPDIVFLFIGSGVEKDKLIAHSKKMNLKNVIFSDEKPHCQMPEIISMSDVCLVPLKNLELFKNALPSKMFEYMACGKPVISTLIGECKELIEQTKSGISVEPENPFKLAEAILKLYNNPVMKQKTGQTGLSLVRIKFTRSKLISRLESQLLKLL